MRRSAKLVDELMRFRCPGPPPHAIVLAGKGEIVKKLADGQYTWIDAETRNVQVIHRPPGIRKPRRHPEPPFCTCPIHGEPLQKRHGPWKDASGKLRWQYYPCPKDEPNHPGWTARYDSRPRPVIPRRERRRRRGLTRGQAHQARKQHRSLLHDLQILHKFIRALARAGLNRAAQKRLIREEVEQGKYKTLRTFVADLGSFLEDRAIYDAKAWIPSELTLELLSERYQRKPSTLARKILPKAK